jgi:VIT1/CCC1 family predicted Fe2+/Mn2+ transporter
MPNKLIQNEEKMNTWFEEHIKSQFENVGKSIDKVAIGQEEIKSDIISIKEDLAVIKDKNIDHLREEFQRFQISATSRITELQVKSGIFGLIGGLLPALAVVIYTLIKNG